MKLVAVDTAGTDLNGGRIYTSTDSGATWTPRDSFRAWNAVASSTDGVNLVATVYEGGIYTSTNSGQNWTLQSGTAGTSPQFWSSVACSGDGQRIVAVAGWLYNTGLIWSSTNGGTSWTSQQSPRKWYSVASSADGTKAVAGSYGGGQLYTGVLPVPTAPTLTTVNTLTGASEDTAFTISYATLAAAANEADADAGTTLSFRVEAVTTGTLTKGGSPVTLGATLLSPGESLVWTPAANANGTLNAFTVKAWDGALASATAVQVQVAVAAVNDPPTLGAIADPAAINEDAAQQTVNLTGIGAGPGESQALTVTATSSNTALIPNPAVTYTSPAATGSLTYTPVANASGSAIITVTVNDGQAAGNTFARTFTVTVNPVNDVPTLAAISNPAAINEDAAQQTVNLTGISAGPGESQTLTVTATSSNTALIPNPTVTYASPAATGSLTYTPVANASGSATITVTVNDGQASNNTFARTFTVTVNPVNDAPSFTKGSDQTVSASAGAQSVANWATNISPGPGESGQTVSFIITNNTSSNLFITPPAVSSSGTLTFTPAAGANGSATISLKAVDNGVPAAESAVLSFAITVQAPVNHPPSFTLPKVPAGLWSWGGGQKGQLGTAKSEDEYSPLPVESNSDWESVVCGTYHTVAVKRNGELWAWGDDTYGQLGNNEAGEQYSPQRIGTDTNWRSVACGSYHTVAVKRNGELWAWGADNNGQLGTGSGQQDQQSPQQIGADTDWQSVACGSDYTAAIKWNGTLWAWGSDSSGQLGNGATTGEQPSPQQIGTDTDWQSVACGSNHTAAIKRNGTLWAWGSDYYGQLGNGATTGDQSSPQQIGTDTDWQSVACGSAHTVAVKRNGTLWAWGNDAGSQLGNGAATGDQPSPQQIGTDTNWQSVACGGVHTVAVKRNGTLWVWGSADHGQLGNGTGGEQISPQQVGTDTYWQVPSCGYIHTAATKRSGAVSWGKDWGQRIVAGFVTNISNGGEAGQAVSFTVTTDNPALFPQPPQIDSSGALIFTSAPGLSGDAVVSITAVDSGTGNNSSAPQTFSIHVLANAVRASAFVGNNDPIDLVNKALINDTGAPVTLTNPVNMGGNSVLHSLPGEDMSLTGPNAYGSNTNLDAGGNTVLSGCDALVVLAQVINFIHTLATITTPSPGPANTSLTKTLPSSGAPQARSSTGSVTPVPGRVKVTGQGEMTACSVKITSLTNTLEFAATSFAPGGTGAGTLQTLNATWGAGVLYECEISKADGTAGAAPGWDLWNCTGTFKLVPVSGEKHWISLRSLTTANVSGPMANFNKNVPYAWKIVSATGGITGFSPDLFELETSGIRNDFGGGSFGVALQNSNRDLVITYTPALRTGNWTSDATSGIDATRGTLWARRFGSTTAATINGVSIPGINTTTVSSAEFDLTGPTATLANDTNTLTALGGTGSAELAKHFIYGGNPVTLTLKQLTPGYTYTASLFSVGWDTTPGIRAQIFSSGTDTRLLDQNLYGDNAGCRMDYTFTADAATRALTITPSSATYTFHLYAVALRLENILPPTVTAQAATAVSATGATLNGTVVSSDARSAFVNRGFVLSATGDNPAPERNAPGVTDFPVTGTTGAFSQAVTGLVNGTQYSVAAYAENSGGIAYSNVVTFRAVTETLVTPVTIQVPGFSSELGAPFDRVALHCIDDSGLTNGLHGTVPDGNMWLTKGTFQAPNDPLPAEITFDMGNTVELSSIHIWNYNEAGFNTRGCKDVTISVASTAGGAFTTVGNYVFGMAPGAANYAGERMAFSRANVRQVKFTITTNWGDTNQFAGLSEVKFYSVPPSTDARLASLTISSGTLTPAFSPNVYNYTVTVPDSVTSVSVTPTSVAAGAAISVGNTSVASGTASPAVNLPAVGIPYLLTVSVIPPGVFSIYQYNIVITRVVPPPPPVPVDFGMARNGSNLEFSFTSASGRTYTLWRSDTLDSGWTNTGLPAITGDGTAKTMTIPAPNASVPKRYYRLQVQ